MPVLPSPRRCCALLALGLAGTALAGGTPPGLPAPVRQALAAADLPADSLGVHVRRVDEARPLVTLNADRPYALASTAKVVTALAALELLGPAYRWRTFAYAGGPIVDGRLRGDLLIAGGGDASLTSADLVDWFTRLRAEGLQAIDGNLVLDRFAFRLQPADFARTPVPDPQRPHHAWPDALMVDEGVVEVDMMAAPSGRGALRVSPALADVKLVDATSRTPGCEAQAELDDAPGTSLRLVVRGSWTPACGLQRLRFTPLTQGEHAVHAVAAAWRRAGGAITGRVIDRDAASGSGVTQRDGDGTLEMPLSVHLSAPLADGLRDILKTSNNLGARNLMLSLAPGFPMQPATLEAAQARVAGWLRSQGLGPTGLQIDSGAGLSRGDRGTPRALVELLCRAWPGRHGATLLDTLPVAGVDGTLAHRFVGTPAQGRAFLKTGTLLDARALAGYVRGRSGRLYAVAALLNHPDAARGVPALDALIDWIAERG